MKKQMVFAVLILMALAPLAHAEGGNAIVSGTVKILKSPVTILEKWSRSMDGGTKISYSEDVAVSDVYDLDAETTG